MQNALKIAGAGILSAAAVGGIAHTYVRLKANQGQEKLNGSLNHWDRWSKAAEKEFPGMRLDTPSDHRRADSFLHGTPPPDYVRVEHEPFTRMQVEYKGKGVPGVESSTGAILLSAIGAFGLVGGGVAALGMGKGSWRMAGAMMAGAGAGLAVGAFTNIGRSPSLGTLTTQIRADVENMTDEH